MKSAKLRDPLCVLRLS